MYGLRMTRWPGSIPCGYRNLCCAGVQRRTHFSTDGRDVVSDQTRQPLRYSGVATNHGPMSGLGQKAENLQPSICLPLFI